MFKILFTLINALISFALCGFVIHQFMMSRDLMVLLWAAMFFGFGLINSIFVVIVAMK